MTPEENKQLTQVGKGTPAGEMLRRYWWPVWFSEQVTTKPVPVRLLGEDLILFRDASGQVGVLDRRCPHRGASLELGRVEADGIRCCYHGWKFDRAGRCLDMPCEPADTPLKDEVHQTAYLTQEAGGLVFAYLGPQPAPLLPKYDMLFREDMNRVLYSKEEHCNWLQRAENGYDPHHLMSLHAPGYPQIALKRADMLWTKTWYGCRTEQRYPDRLVNVTHQIFPSHTRRLAARKGDEPRHYLNLRVPVDDTKTLTFFVSAVIAENGPYTLTTKGHDPCERMVYEEVDDGWWRIPSHEQDRIAQESQGLVADRSREYLGTSDEGIVVLRKILRDSIKAVAEGRDPFGVIRDPGQNDVVRFDAGKNFSDGVNKAPEIIRA
ncbi:MAG TPA: Rieske 2Fe-2S domain-containing protein [Alphaproteobacteria bacterium]|nr:Rieske 2Fe-2S domain-containing protein [Alphaproteobacteria bacterium]